MAASSQNQPRISVVIPVFNEEDNLVELHARLAATMNAAGDAWEVIYVDDGSKDKSWDLLCRIQSQDEPTCAWCASTATTASTWLFSRALRLCGARWW